MPYFENMIANYIGLSQTHELRFYAHCMDKCEVDARKLTTYVISAANCHSSEGHAFSLNSAFKLCSTLKDINLIADNDTVMLARGWDTTLANLLETTGVVGASFERIGGWSSGPGLRQMYKDKPTVTWFAMSPKYDFSRLDTAPAMTKDVPVVTEEQSKLYNLPIGYSLFCDTGWKIPAYLEENSIPYIAMAHEKPTGKAIAVKSGNDYHEEFQLAGVPFVGHQRGSRKHACRTSPISKSFYDACDAYIKTLK
jgi:hypothetical protein